jgi:hypothetical protein
MTFLGLNMLLITLDTFLDLVLFNRSCDLFSSVGFRGFGVALEREKKTPGLLLCLEGKGIQRLRWSCEG